MRSLHVATEARIRRYRDGAHTHRPEVRSRGAGGTPDGLSNWMVPEETGVGHSGIRDEFTVGLDRHENTETDQDSHEGGPAVTHHR